MIYRVMPLVTMTVFALLSYALAAMSVGVVMVSDKKKNYTFSYGATVAGLAFHGYLLYQWIDRTGSYFHSQGQNLYYFNLISMICWLAVGVILLVSLRKPTQSLLLLNLSLAVVSILAVVFFPGDYRVSTQIDSSALIHILASIVVTSLFCIAAGQALLLSLQDYFLRSNRNVMFLRILPPIETMENILFQVIGLGFILLSFVVVTSLLLLSNSWGESVTHGILMALVAWMTFAVLLWGRYRRGFRGKTAIRLTLIGFALLGLSYFGHWLIFGWFVG